MKALDAITERAANRPPFHIDPPSVADKDASEIEIQTGFRNQMRILAPHVMLVAIPNAGKRTQWAARQVKREGMVTGFPDMMALHDGRAAFLEFKARTGTVSDAQIECLNRLAARDFAVGVFRSADTAISWLRGNGFV